MHSPLLIVRAAKRRVFRVFGGETCQLEVDLEDLGGGLIYNFSVSGFYSNA